MGHVEAILGHSSCEGQDLGPWQPGGAGEQGVEEALGEGGGVLGEGGFLGRRFLAREGDIRRGGVGRGLQEGRRRPPKEKMQAVPPCPRGRIFTCHRAGELHIAPSPFRGPPPRAQAGQGGQARERGDQVTGRGGLG